MLQRSWSSKPRYSMSSEVSLGSKMAYSGKSEGCTLRPPYSEDLRILGGTNKPNETAMMRFIGSPSRFGSCIFGQSGKQHPAEQY